MPPTLARAGCGNKRMSSEQRQLGLWSVTAIGIGGMVGGGIFAVLGLAVQLARGGTPVAFLLAGIVALLSTGSAINATLYGSVRISHIFARDGELPEFRERQVWRQPLEGLLITAALALLVANAFNLSNISVMVSAGFLLVFAGVNAANVRLSRETGARRWLSVAGTASCLLALSALVWQRSETDPASLAVPAVMMGLAFAIELSYRQLVRHTPPPIAEE